MRSLPKTILTCAFALGACAATGVGQIVSANFSHVSGAGNSAIDGSETFGVAALGTEVGNWNNFNFSMSSLITSDGTATTIDVTSTQPNAIAFYGASYINTPLNYGPDHYTGTPDDPGTSITFTNLNANFSEGYFAIAYLTGFVGNTGGSITDGNTTFYYRSADPAVTPTPASLVETTTTVEPAAGSFPVAQYAVFGSSITPLTGDSLTLRIDEIYGGGAGLGGVQLVGVSDLFAIPEPSLIPLMMGFAACGVVLVRRRRRS